MGYDIIPVLLQIKADPDGSAGLQYMEEHTTISQTTFACEKCNIYKTGKSKTAEERAGIKSIIC